MHPLSLFVLVDSDPKGLETLAYAFKRDGCAVVATSDPRTAPELVRSNDARLVVVAVREPERPALDLISGLHIHPETKNLPIVALGPVALRPEALAAGAFDYLNTPLFVKDVVTIGRLVLLMREAATEANPTLQIRAPLADYHGLFYLVRAMAGTGRSGILQLTRGHHRGEVRFNDGAVTSAETGSLQGAPALHQLLLWSDGTIALTLRDVPRRGQFSLSAEEILDESGRFLRDFAHAVAELGSPQVVFVPDERHAASAAAVLPTELGSVARLFDGQRPLGDVIEVSPFRIFDTLRIVKRLVDSGALVAREGAAPAPGTVRARTKTAAQGSRHLAPSELNATADRRGVVTDRRRSAKSQRIAAPAAPVEPAPPIPLVVRKGMPSGMVAGEIAPRRLLRPSKEPSRAVSGDAPTVQVKLDHIKLDHIKLDHIKLDHIKLEGPRISLDQPVPSIDPEKTPPPVADAAKTPAPVAASAKTPPPAAIRRAPSSASNRAARSKKADLLTPAPVFDAVESDFFAREADLYKREAVETFDDLEHAQPSQHQAGHVAATAPSPGGAQDKK
jgi:CheY-like chemotaxis protein